MKTETKWRVAPAGNIGRWHILDENDNVIADCPSETSEAEANVLAASPELLAACKTMLENLEESEMECGHSKALLRAAIACAERPA